MMTSEDVIYYLISSVFGAFLILAIVDWIAEDTQYKKNRKKRSARIYELFDTILPPPALHVPADIFTSEISRETLTTLQEITNKYHKLIPQDNQPMKPGEIWSNGSQPILIYPDDQYRYLCWRNVKTAQNAEYYCKAEKWKKLADNIHKALTIPKYYTL